MLRVNVLALTELALHAGKIDMTRRRRHPQRVVDVVLQPNPWFAAWPVPARYVTSFSLASPRSSPRAGCTCSRIARVPRAPSSTNALASTRRTTAHGRHALAQSGQPRLRYARAASSLGGDRFSQSAGGVLGTHVAPLADGARQRLGYDAKAGQPHRVRARLRPWPAVGHTRCLFSGGGPRRASKNHEDCESLAHFPARSFTQKHAIRTYMRGEDRHRPKGLAGWARPFTSLHGGFSGPLPGPLPRKGNERDRLPATVSDARTRCG